MPLEARRSVAVDPKVTPLGSLGYLEMRDFGGRTWSGLVVAMDTGAAIQGPARLDFFLGTGDEAGRVAGGLSSPGSILWLTTKR